MGKLGQDLRQCRGRGERHGGERLRGGSPGRRHRDRREGEDTRPGRMATDHPKQDGEDGSGCCQGEAEGVSKGEMSLPR